MQYMSIGDENIDKSVTQHLPQTELVARPHSTQYMCSIQIRRALSIVVFILPCIVSKTTLLFTNDASFQRILEILQIVVVALLMKG